jgi:FkbH-like protein
MIIRLADLPWLLPAPPDFRDRCREAETTGGPIGRRLWALANFALDQTKLGRLARLLAAARSAGRDLAPLRPFRLGVIGNSTTDFLAPVLEASALRHGIALEVVGASYGQAMQQALDPRSALQRAAPDAVLLAFDHRALPLAPTPEADAAQAAGMVADALGAVRAIADGFARGCGAPLIVQTVPEAAESLFGSFDHRLPGSAARLTEAFNRGLAELCDGTPHLLLDVAGLARRVGLDAWHDPVQWHLAKLSFSQEFLPLYGDHLGRLIGALRGRSRKCLVLDLDNTCWGGVIGDDGLEGIAVGQGSAVGEAHLAVQEAALALRARGVVLAVCSKNDDEVARRPFRDHPDMLLREEHIAVFQANWVDKASNLRAIAGALNIGTDALVFLDDNPVERGLVREELPEVAVPELPEDPALFARTLLAGGYFETVTFSEDDRRRAAQYQENARRLQGLEASSDVDGYLASLVMVARMGPFDAAGRGRIAQLINKSNQFNLTTRRYTEAEVARLEDDTSALTLQVRLADRFGDNGMISVVICRPAAPDTWDIDTWLMSCRVLGRGVEHAVLNEVVRRARDRGIRTLLGRYVPSGRNDMVADHYPKLGFAPAGTEGAQTLWRLEVAGEYAGHPVHIRTEVEAGTW